MLKLYSDGWEVPLQRIVNSHRVLGFFATVNGCVCAMPGNVRKNGKLCCGI